MDCEPEYMLELFQETDFEMIAQYGNFEKGKLTETSSNAIYLVRKTDH